MEERSKTVRLQTKTIEEFFPTRSFKKNGTWNYRELSKLSPDSRKESITSFYKQHAGGAGASKETTNISHSSEPSFSMILQRTAKKTVTRRPSIEDLVSQMKRRSETGTSEENEVLSDELANQSRRKRATSMNGVGSRLIGSNSNKFKPKLNVTPHIPALTQILDDPIKIELFKLFLDQEYSSEALLFWKDAEMFRKGSSTETIRAEAKLIWDKYFGPESVYPINIDSDIRDGVATLLLEPDIDRQVLTEAQSRMYELMNDAPFRRFLTSSIWKNWLDDQEVEFAASKLRISQTDTAYLENI